MFRKLSTLVLFLLLGSPIVAFAQNTGKLSGRVTDANTGEGLPSATIVLQGTQIGAATDLDGNYVILGVPVGDYDIIASFVGFESETQNGVGISSGRTRILDFALREDTQIMEGVVIEYTRPLIENDAIGVPKVLSGDDIENLPVRGVANVAAIQGGVISDDGSSTLNIRGGRGEEVTYYVDGVKVTGALGVPTQAIQEQEMLIGTIPPRYGDAMSGVISISTRAGGSNFFGSLEGVTSEALDSYGYSLGSLSLGGPILAQNRASFFLSGQYERQADNSPYGIETLVLNDDVYNDLQASPQAVEVRNTTTGEIAYLTIPTSIGAGDDLDALAAALGSQLDGFEIVNGSPVARTELISDPSLFTTRRGKDNPDRDLTLTGNLTFRPLSALSLRLGGTINDSKSESFSYTRSWYNRDATTTDEDRTVRFYGTLRQSISNTAFYQLQGEYTDQSREIYPTVWGPGVENALFYGDIDAPENAQLNNYLSFNPTTGLYTNARSDGSLSPGSAFDTFSNPGTVQSRHDLYHNNLLRFSGSATTQLGVHQLEFGGEWEKATRRAHIVATTQLSNYFADGFAEAGADSVSTYGQTDADGNYVLPSDAFTVFANWYGYDYLGLNEVDSENLAGFADGTNRNVAPYQPIYYGGYLRDKIEFSDLVIDLGVRVDAFDNNTRVLRDLYALQDIYRVSDFGGGNDILNGTQVVALFPESGVPSNIGSDYAIYMNNDVVVGYRDLDGQFYDAGGQPVATFDVITDQGSPEAKAGGLAEGMFTDYETQYTFMPRVGVSFPVTGQALFFASYNVTSQRPSENAFASLLNYFNSNSGQTTPNNPGLKPEITTQYELGFRQRVGETAAFTLSGFYRTQENKIALRTIYGAFPNTYNTYRNVDFSTTKGLELGFELRRTAGLAVNANYTLSFAEGTGSDSATTSIIAWRGTTYPETITPLEFDNRHSINVSLDYRFAEGEGPMIMGEHPLGGFGFNVLGQFKSGGPYTPLADIARLNGPDASFGGIADGVAINDTYKPWTNLLNLRVDRSFDFGPAQVKAYVNVTNLLGTENVLGVYRATGLADNDGFLDSEGGDRFLRNNLGSDLQRDAFRFAYGNYSNSPVTQSNFRTGANGNSMYGLPRQVRVGFILDF